MTQKYKQANGSKAVYTYHEIDDRDECNLFMSVTAALVGMGAGIVCHMTPVYLPSVLNDSFAFRNTLFWKMIFSVIAGALVFNAITSILKKGITRVWSGNGVITGIVGAIILGAGMAMSQSDPMLLFVALGTFTKSSMFTFAGALLGAMSWGFIYDLIPKEKTRLKPQYFDAMCKGKIAFFVVALPVACCFAAGAFCMDKFGKSYKSEGPLLFHASLLYSPYFVGGALALLQLPLAVFFCKSLQGFCSHLATVAFPINQIGRACNLKLPGYIRFTGSLSSSWSILMGLGIFFGSMAAGVLGLKNAYFVEEGSSMMWSVLGGFLMMIGSIYAGGDVFALSAGVANLHIPSFINLGVVVLGAFGTTKVMESLGIKF
eukprot:GHVH01017092.1.p1 GENE.GHVH01017092.1~~GHVH01017092.1.p1  ORF type:complete len:374 (+),score=49.91 GHVH01017092.1:283-1404(+)